MSFESLWQQRQQRLNDNASNDSTNELPDDARQQVQLRVAVECPYSGVTCVLA